MLITIWRDGTEPLSGRVGLEHGDPQPFVGWLQLLGILSQVLDPDRLRPPTGDGGRELHP